MRRVFLLACTCLVSCFAEEGMWPFHQIPKQHISQKYGVDLTDQWLDHVQKSSLRISAGGSGSFISSKGLVMTNHHVGASAIQNLSSKEANFFEEGFYAATREEELPCANLYIDQLVSVSDITQEVNAQISEGLSFAEKDKLRKVAMAQIQKKAEETGLHPEVVTLYNGAQYHLYLYKRYSDVRLVMAPERSCAFLGGDEDNFEYPRYNLDMCFFRVYEQGLPLQSEHYFTWGVEGPLEGELLFVSGHPGKTKRMWTADHLQYSEEVEIPLILNYAEKRMEMLNEFAARGDEEKRKAMQLHHSFANAHKVYKGLEKGFKLASPSAHKQQKDALLYGSETDAAYAPWAKLKEALSKSKTYIESYFVLEGIASNYSKLYGVAKSLVRLAQEKKLPNDKRLLEYVDTEMEGLELKILSSEPFYQDLAEAYLSDSFQMLFKVLGDSHPLITQVFNGKSPKEVAREIALSTTLYDENVRRDLYENLEKVESSQDPLIVFARAVDPYAREIRKQKEEELDGVQTQCYAEIAEQEFNRYGTLQHPDATFTLRLSFGEMKGYEDFKPFTTFDEMYQHAKEHNFEGAYALSKRCEAAMGSLDPSVPLNFVSTHDIIGGNSGSPVINAKGEWVGLIFDGNAYSITWSHLFDETLGRSISVHSRGIVEALQNIYHADALVREIQGI